MPGLAHSDWGKRLSALVLYIAVALVAFYGTAKSVVTTWIELETYNHGFLIVPIFLWLIWRQRRQLVRVTLGSDPLALFAMTGSGILWLSGALVDALVVQQFALVGLLISGTWAILGRQFARQTAFPLAFLFFAVPMGDGLVPFLIDYTASFTVRLVELTGIPVYQEGRYFYLPSGNWSVIAACSGVRYLIASVTLGCVYAYISYNSLFKRLFFILLSIILPILANGLRAYMIVMIGHLSNMELAVGVDHLLYGWVFFGLVMFGLFYLGSFWRDDQVPATRLSEAVDTKIPPILSCSTGIGFLAFFASVVLLALIWPGLSYALDHREMPAGKPLQIAFKSTDVEEIEAPWPWVPQSIGADQVLTAHYRHEDNLLGVHLYQYLHQEQGAELVTSVNIYAGHKHWRKVSKGSFPLELETGHIDVNQALMKSARQTLLVWMFYRVGDDYTGNDYVAKGLEALRKLSLGRLDSARILVAVEIDDDGKPALSEGQSVLSGFLTANLPDIAAALDKGAGH